MNPYRAAPVTTFYAVTVRTRLKPCCGPYEFMSNTTMLDATDEDDAVTKAVKKLERQGFDVIDCTDVHRVGAAPEPGPANPTKDSEGTET